MQQGLETQISTALDQDPQATHAIIDVAALGGQAMLSGEVRTAEEKAAAVQIAKQVPGVVNVVDDLVIRPTAARK